MVVLVRLVKRDKLRCRTALRSWMPRRGATIIGCGCLQNPVMLHDDMMSQFLGHCQVLGNLRSFSVANRFQKAALIAVAYQLTTEDPWCRTCRSEACNLIRHSPASALQLPHRSNRSCGKSLRNWMQMAARNTQRLTLSWCVDEFLYSVSSSWQSHTHSGFKRCLHACHHDVIDKSRNW